MATKLSLNFEEKVLKIYLNNEKSFKLLEFV